MLIRVLSGVIAVMCLFACDSRMPTAESRGSLGPSAVPRLTPTTAAVVPAARSSDVVVNMQDACDPETFNAAIGPGTCVRSGGVKFDDFLAQLSRLGFVGPWHFAPNNVNAKTGETFLVINRGGEVHTFTEVEEFAGGIVPELNERMHLSTVAPECLALNDDDFVAPGQTYREDIEEEGNEKYQCCIHPWMRLEARVSEAPAHHH